MGPSAAFAPTKSGHEIQSPFYEQAYADHYAIATGKLRMQIYHVITRHRTSGRMLNSGAATEKEVQRSFLHSANSVLAYKEVQRSSILARGLPNESAVSVLA